MIFGCILIESVLYLIKTQSSIAQFLVIGYYFSGKFNIKKITKLKRHLSQHLCLYWFLGIAASFVLITFLSLFCLWASSYN